MFEFLGQLEELLVRGHVCAPLFVRFWRSLGWTHYPENLRRGTRRPLLKTREYKISDFGLPRFSKRARSNPDYRRLGRNELCFCSSGKKFKRCCIAKETSEGDHVDITPRRTPPERAIA